MEKGKEEEEVGEEKEEEGGEEIEEEEEEAIDVTNVGDNCMKGTLNMRKKSYYLRCRRKQKKLK